MTFVTIVGVEFYEETVLKRDRNWVNRYAVMM